MSPELDERLCTRYPLLYRQRNGDPRQTCMCWGFECGDGWFDLLDDVSRKLERAIEALPAEEREHTYAQQVKEKFGGLRLYLSSGTDEMYAAIDQAEELSQRTCEVCGAPGEPRGGGWVKTLCSDHAIHER